ncbi:MAG: hypothetical protein IJ581_00420 [Paludibacteraceae bacterium]|nr:hypothetical protein [Paludibacteraceae bacterium]
MKKTLLFCLTLLALCAYAKEPAWVKKRPLPENNTYEYRCEEATDQDRDAAEQKAMAEIINGAIMRLGLAVDAGDVQNAMQYGTPLEVAEQYRIPINKVCSYTQKIEGGYRCYVLCQVALSAAIIPQWTPYNKCGSASSGKDVVEVDYPSEWKQYEGEDYFASFQHEQYAKGETKQAQALNSLLAVAERELRNKLGIDEGDNEFNTYTDSRKFYSSSARSDGEDGFVVVFVTKKQLLSYYRDATANYMDNIRQSLEQARSMADEGVKGDAEIELQFAQQQLNEAARNTNRLQAYGVDVTTTRNQQNMLQKRITELLDKVKGDTGRGKREKIANYIDIAIEAQQDARIAEALQYFYWANVLLNSFAAEEANLIQYNDGKKDNQLTVWLPKHINDLLKNITFSYAGNPDDEEDMGMVNVLYNKKPVKSLEYRYFTNIDWSEIYRAKDGTGVIRFYEDENKEKKLIVRIEYAFTAEANADKEVAALMDKYAIDYSKAATKQLNIRKTKTMEDNSMSLPIAVETGSKKTGSSIREGKYAETTASVLSEEEAKVYSVMIDNICEALRTKKGTTVTSYFTPEGRQLFLQLTKSGRITVLDKKHVTYYRMGDNVVARSVKMSFDYPNNHKTFVEDVVFEFNPYRKIENVRYMLERGTIEDLAAQSDWSDAAKLALTDFLENYKSSFALRDTSYLHHVFDDNAVIITGRVVKPVGDQKRVNLAEKEHIEYTRHTKSSYLTSLSRVFSSNSFVNVAFSDLYITPALQFPNMYGLRLKQTYTSSRYGDQGYLFLLMDLTDYENPIIYVRTWQPKPDTNMLPGDGLFGTDNFK